MKPVVVVVGETYADARQYVLANMDTRPALQVARVLSASSPRWSSLDETTQTVLTREMNDWWRTLAMAQRVQIHLLHLVDGES